MEEKTSRIPFHSIIYIDNRCVARYNDFMKRGVKLKKPSTNNGIVHSNKDIISKVLTQNYQNKSLAVYGLTNVPKIKRMLSADYPVVTATEFHGDNVFLLEDNWLLVLEYESQPRWEDFLKYNKYAIHAVERLSTEGIRIEKVVIAVLYTGDVQETAHELDLGGFRVHVEQVYLSKFDTDALYAELKEKVTAGERLTDEDVMRFIILPLTQPDKKRKQGLIEDTVSLVKQLQDDGQQAFIMAGILTATNKFIDPEYAKKVREWLKMLKVVRLIDEEARIDERKIMAKRMLIADEPIRRIMDYTELSMEEIKQIQSELELVSA